jgi:hypothetical protein
MASVWLAFLNDRLEQRTMALTPAWVRPENHAHMLDGLRKAGWKG